MAEHYADMPETDATTSVIAGPIAMRDPHPLPGSWGEPCALCVDVGIGRTASHKIKEDADDAPIVYMCCHHFARVMGPAAAQLCRFATATGSAHGADAASERAAAAHVRARELAGSALVAEAERLLADLRDQLADSRHEVANLDVALRTSRMIGLAIGILMTRHGMTQEQTVTSLLRYSQRRNRKLRELAAEAISLGDLVDFAGLADAG